jgi:hypothetical protein
MERLIVFSSRAFSQILKIVGFAFVLSLSASKVFALTDQQYFSSPEQAVQSLLESIKADNSEALLALFGEKYKEQLFSGDAVEDKNNRQQFAATAALKQRIEKQGENRAIFIVGNEDFVFPIPLVKESNNWRFDTESGIDEIINRRIGRNELNAINVLKAYTEVQLDYASIDRDNDDILEYAQKIRSTPGQHDGLFWEADASGESSLLGPLFAAARAENYFGPTTSDAPQPYHGYYYKLLTRQGCGAVGGQYDYVINGNMIAGFGMIAFPAKYGSSGIMSFIVNHQGKIFEKDLGAKTAILVKSIKEFTPVGWEAIDN